MLSSVPAGAVVVLLLISAATSRPVLPTLVRVPPALASVGIRTLEGGLALMMLAGMAGGSLQAFRLGSGATGLLFAAYTVHHLRGARAGSVTSCGCTPFVEAPSHRTALRAASVAALTAGLSATALVPAPTPAEWLMAGVLGTAMLFWPAGFGLVDQVLRQLQHEHRWDAAGRD